MPPALPHGLLGKNHVAIRILGTSPWKNRRWLPADWPELERSALVAALERLDAAKDDPEFGVDLNERADAQRAATCLYWLTSDDPEVFSVEELEGYARRWAFERTPDEGLDRQGWLRAFIHLHASAALLIKLHATEEGFSGRARELIDHLAALAAYVRATDGLREPDTFYQPMPDYYNGTVSMRRSFALLCALAWCFRFHLARADGDAHGAFDAAVRAFAIAEDGSFTDQLFFDEPGCEIERGEIVVLGLVGWWLEPRDVAAAFEDLYEAQVMGAASTPWVRLADNFLSLDFEYQMALTWLGENHLADAPRIHTRIGEARDLDGSTWSPSYQLAEYWAFARALCISRLSRDEYRDLRMDDERHTARDRLKRYFFTDIWEDVPPVAQDALITADLIHWAQEGSKATLPENLRLATEAILEERLVQPFRAWCAANERAPARRSHRREASLKLTLFLGELWDDGRLFSEFASDAYQSVGRREWEEIRQTLDELRGLRNASAHPGERGAAGPDQVKAVYRKVVGIGCSGVLPRLLKLQPPTA